MKVFEIGTGYTPIPAKMGAATEIVVEELTKSLQKQKVDVSIVDIKTTDRLPNNLPIIEVPVPSKFTGTDVKLGMMHKLKRVIYSISLAFKLKSIIKNEKEKVVLHFHNQYNMFFFLKLSSKALREKAVLAYTVHSYVWDANWDDIKHIVYKRYFQEITCMKSADLVYVLNDKSASIFINELGIDKKKIVMIDNGVNTELYHPLNKRTIENLKSAKGLTDAKVFLQIGSVCDRKNQVGAIEMLKDFLKENKNAYYIYAGGVIDEKYQKTIFDLADNWGVGDKIKYLGEVSPGKELNEVYNLADVMIFPSKNEAFGLVIIEAMSAGIPTIISGNIRLVLDNAIQCRNKEELDSILKSLVFGGQRNIVAEKSRKEIVAKYSWDKVAKDYINSWENN